MAAGTQRARSLLWRACLAVVLLSIALLPLQRSPERPAAGHRLDIAATDP